MNYTIEEHRHRFAAWAASRAASVKTCRFKVEQGKIILEESGLREIGYSVTNLPETDQFDQFHQGWRLAAIQSAGKLGLEFTHGIAAKLINIYLKSIYVCGNDFQDRRVNAIHPPIDSILLNELYQQDVGGYRKQWNEFKKIRWSKLSSGQYDKLIELIKEVVPPSEGLWTIEKYWRGYQ